jgi:ComEC/Rec2-related protein
MIFLLASIAGFFMPVIIKIVLLVVSSIVFIASVLLSIFKQIDEKKQYAHLCVVLSSVMAIVAFISSILFFDVQKEKYSEYYGKTDRIEAVVTSVGYESNFMSSYNVKVKKFGEDDKKHSAVLLCEYDAALEVGDSILAIVVAEEPDDIGGQYNEKLSMLSDGIFIRYVSKSSDGLSKTDSGKISLDTVMSSINGFFSNILRKLVGDEEGNLSSALFLGNKQLLSSSVARDFSRAGASHILALSGMHMSIIMGAAMFILRRLRVKTRLTAVILSAIAIFYLALTGFSVSATRSVIMLLIVYFSIIVEGTSDSLTSLSIAGVIIFLFSPGTIADPSFWMSFSATLGILVYMPGIVRFTGETIYRLEKVPKAILKAFSSVVTIFLTGIFATLPLVAVMSVFIREMSLMSILSTVVLSVPASVLLIISMLLIPLSGVPFISSALASAIRFVAKIMIGYCAEVSAWEGTVFSLNYPFAYLFAIAIAFTLLYSFVSRHKNLFVSLIPFAVCVLLMIGTCFVYERINEENVRVSYINASSNSDMLVVSNNREAVICDISNGSKSSYSLALNEAFEARVTEIKAIVLTRYTYSHHATFYELFQSERVWELWLPQPESYEEYCIMERMYDTASANGVKVYLYKKGEALRIFDYTYLEHVQEYIERSAVPVSVVSIYTSKERVTYVAPGFNESAANEYAEYVFTKSDYVVFGNRGPKTKTNYSIKNLNSVEAIFFADEARAAYFDSKEYGNPALFLVPEKITVIIEKN